MAKLIGEIEYFRGDSYPKNLTIKSKETKQIIDLTGYSFIFTVDSLKDPKDATTKKFSVAGVIDPDPVTGKVSFTPTKVNTNMIAAGYFYDIQMTDNQGHVRTIAKEKFKITQDISK